MIASMTKTYELMVVARGDFSMDDEEKRKALIETLAGENVSVGNISIVGKKRLAYPINKQTEGVYFLATLNSRALKSSDIEKRARLNENVLRYLLTVKN